jgi:hypothetical protein
MIDDLLKKLQDSKFTGVLELRVSDGAIESARLSHFIGKNQFAADIPLLHSGDCQHGHCHCHGKDRQESLF